MTMTRRKLGSIAAAVAVAAFGASAVAADQFPTDTVRIIVPYGPGGATDIMARIVANGLSETWGQSVIVENRPGANGMVGIQDLVNAPADGYTLFVGNVTSNMLNPLRLGADAPVNALEALRTVTLIGSLPHIMVATQINFPPTTLQEVVEYARERPGQLNHSSAGMLAYTHVDFLRLQDAAGIEMEMVPLQAGAGGGQTDLLTGDVQLAITNAATVLPFVQSGDLRAIAVTSRERLEALPDVQTFSEAGFEGIGTSAWNAMFVSADVPEDRLRAIHEAVLAVLARDDVLAQLQERLIEVEPQATIEEADAWLQAEIEAWTPALATALRVLESR